MIDHKLNELENIISKEIEKASVPIKTNLEIIDIIIHNTSKTWDPWLNYFTVYNKEIIKENRDGNFWKNNIRFMKVDDE